MTQAFDRAGTPNPPPVVLVESSDAQPRASAGLVNQGSLPTVNAVAPDYASLTQATVAAALAKRDADQAVLNK